MATDSQDAEERRKRKRRAILFWLFGGGIAAFALVAAIVFLTGGDGGEPGQPAATDTATSTPTAAADSTATVTASPTPTPTASALDINGRWDITVVNTVTTGACEGEAGSVSVHHATIAQSGDTFTISGFGTAATDVWQGSIDGTTITYSGSRSEDDGTTTATFTLEVDPDSYTLRGSEDWDWSGPGGSCPDSASDVTGSKVG